jgi:AraC-like DNA-binding protein
MTNYQKEIIGIRDKIYSKDYLCSQIIQSKLFIDKNFAGNINLKDLSGKAFFSKFHFIRLFKKNYGRTPYQYLTEVRIVNAKKFLKSGMPVIDVCVSVGFDSVTSFTRLFKKITGSTPAAFKKSSNKKSNFE